MDRLENPVLRRELKTGVRTAKIIPAIVLRYACLGVIYILVLQAQLGKGILAFILAEASLILLFTPGAVCIAFSSSAGRSDLQALFLTRLKPSSIIPGKLAGANLYTFITVVLSALVMFAAAIFRSDLSLWPLIRANAALMVLMFASSAIGLAFAVLFRRNIRTSIALSYLLIVLLIGSVIIPGPVIGRMSSSGVKSAVVKIALYANPIIMTSRALGNVDLMRTLYMYKLADPIVGRSLWAYPDWRYAALIYLVVSCFFLLPTFAGFRRALRPSLTSSWVSGR
jgi:hypothetical protein